MAHLEHAGRLIVGWDAVHTPDEGHGDVPWEELRRATVSRVLAEIGLRDGRSEDEVGELVNAVLALPASVDPFGRAPLIGAEEAASMQPDPTFVEMLRERGVTLLPWFSMFVVEHDDVETLEAVIHGEIRRALAPLHGAGHALFPSSMLERWVSLLSGSGRPLPEFLVADRHLARTWIDRVVVGVLEHDERAAYSSVRQIAEELDRANTDSRSEMLVALDATERALRHEIETQTVRRILWTLPDFTLAANSSRASASPDHDWCEQGFQWNLCQIRAPHATHPAPPRSAASSEGLDGSALATDDESGSKCAEADSPSRVAYVAVLDTGVDAQHSALHSRCKRRVTVGCSFVTEDPDTRADIDLDGHGTMCAGVIGASEYPIPDCHGELLGRGVAPNCMIVPLKVLRDHEPRPFVPGAPVAPRQTGEFSWLLDALHYIVRRNLRLVWCHRDDCRWIGEYDVHARPRCCEPVCAPPISVANTSLGTPIEQYGRSDIFRESRRRALRRRADSMECAVDRAMCWLDALGCVVVASAGNHGRSARRYLTFPGRTKRVVCVGGVDRKRVATHAASEGTRPELPCWYADERHIVDLCAPGALLVSTAPREDLRRFEGASAAAAHVSGAVALAAEILPRRHFCPWAIRVLLRVSADPTARSRSCECETRSEQAEGVPRAEHATSQSDPCIDPVTGGWGFLDVRKFLCLVERYATLRRAHRCRDALRKTVLEAAAGALQDPLPDAWYRCACPETPEDSGSPCVDEPPEG